MDVLSRMLGAIVNGGSFAGFSVGSLNISHLLFIDDTLLFCKPEYGQVQYLRAVFFRVSKLY